MTGVVGLRSFLLFGLIAVAAMLPFLAAVGFGLVDLDDGSYLGDHPVLWEGTFIETLKFAFGAAHDAIWMPLTWLSYALDYRLWGEWWGGFHLHSIVVHAVNAGLVWALLREIFGEDAETAARRWTLVLLALVWAVHPLRCESVVFVASRKDVLSLAGLLLALIAWVRGSRAQGLRGEVGWTALSLAFFAVGAMAKPSVMTFPVLALLIDVFALGRVRFWRYPLPVAAAVALGWSAAVSQSVGGAMAETQGETLLMRLQVAAAAFGIYLRNFAWPQDLAVQCVRRWPELPRFLLPGTVLLLAYAGFCACRFRGRLRAWRGTARIVRTCDFPVALALAGTGAAKPDYLLLGLGWFAVAVGPMLGIVGFGYHAFADRFTYIPAIGLSIALGGLVLKGAVKCPRLVNGVLLAVVLALGAATVRQTGFWRDERTLFAHTLEVDGARNALAHVELGMWYFNHPHDLERSVDAFAAAWRINPREMLSTFNVYAFALCELGRTDGLEQLIEDYWKVVLDRYDPHRRAGSSIFARVPETLPLRGVYLTAQVALGLADPTKRALADLADERLREIRRQGRRASPIWLYLLMRQAEKAGRAQEAAEIRAWILEGTKRLRSTQFNYLREGTAKAERSVTQ